MNIIILFLLAAIILIIYNNCRVKEDFHNIYNRGYVNPYIQQPILFPIYSPYRRYYEINAQLPLNTQVLLNTQLPLNAQVPLNYPYFPSMFAPYYSQYDILNRNGINYI
jgi:hypothetical protein